MEQTLLLNATFEPLKVISWQRAMTLFVQGRAEVIDTHDREVRAVTFTFKMPSIVRLLRFVKVKNVHAVKFSRANIYIRDEYTCQYCAQVFEAKELTFDHVVPVAKGGRRSWDNIVTACQPCNRKKDDRSPADAGMTLIRTPRRPTASARFRVSIGIHKTPESWRSFVYWNLELDHDAN
jgi:5-methylcytosine-specific restriction endonuclease McrA